MKCQDVKGVAEGAPRLEVGEERLWRTVYVECFWVPEFSHPCIIHNGEDKLRSLAPRRLVGAGIVALGPVHRFCARADNNRGIVIDRHVVGSDAFWFGKLHAIAHCVS